MDKSPERIRRMFGTIAHRYDLINSILTLGIDRLWRRFTAQTLLHEQTGDILDICCGTGELSLAFARQLQTIGNERNIYGIDFSPEMIDIAQRKAQNASNLHSANLHFAIGDALDLPFEDSRFAVVAVAFGLRNVCDTQRGLAELVRVCKAGGTVAVLDFSMPTLPVVRHCYRFYSHILLPRLGQWFARNKDQAYYYLPESVLQFDQPAQLAQRMTQHGIVEIQMKPMSCGIVTLVWGRKELAKT